MCPKGVEERERGEDRCEYDGRSCHVKWEKVRSRRVDEGVEMMENIEMSRLVEVNIDELYK